MENNTQKRIDAIGITEEDLYFLSHIEGIKSTAGFFKAKYNKYMYGILNKYNIDSIDILMISRYVKEKKFHLKAELIEKYGPYDITTAKTDFDFKGMKAFAILLGIFIIVAVAVKLADNAPSACDCVDILGVPTKKVGIGMPLPVEHLSNEDFRKYEKCYDAYAGPATATLECAGK
jgi:hypothetical protein